MLAVMPQLHNRLHVTYLPLHTPTAEEVADPNRFAMGMAAESLRRLALPGARGQLQSAVDALSAFVASPRWKPPELAGHLYLDEAYNQTAYDFNQGLFVPVVSQEAATRPSARS